MRTLRLLVWNGASRSLPSSVGEDIGVTLSMTGVLGRLVHVAAFSEGELSPAAQGRHARSLRFRPAVSCAGRFATKCVPAVQLVRGVHSRLLVAVGALDSHSSEPQVLSGAQTRSETNIFAVTSQFSGTAFFPTRVVSVAS